MSSPTDRSNGTRSRLRWIRAGGLAGVAAISFSAIFYRLSGASPSTAAFYRCAYALPVLLALRLVLPDRVRRTASLRLLGGFAGVLLAADLALWHRAIGLIGAGLGTVLANTQVVFVALAGWLLHRERPTPVALAVLPLALIGVALIGGIAGGSGYGVDPVKGTIFGLLTGLTYATFLIVFRRAGVSGGALTRLMEVTAGAVLGSVVFALFSDGIDWTPAWPGHGWLLALALGPQALGWLAIAYVLPRLPALEVSVLLLLQPIATVVWGRLVFGEWLSLAQWMGALLVLVAVGLLMLKGAVEGRRERSPSEEDAVPT